MSTVTKHALALCCIAAVSVAVYAPAIDNSFISDDFGIFPLLQAFEQNPSYIFDTTSELFRVMSYVYFWACFSLFGLNSELYYLAGIALHALISVLVYVLVLRATGRQLAALPAALFFAAYERHQEAVMWISAANELVLTFWCLVFLIVWDRAISREQHSRLYSAAAFPVLALALFSKEAATALVPMAILALILHGYSRKEVIERSIPVFAMCVTFGLLWLSQADRNFFVADGHYALTPNAVWVYNRALVRLLSPAIPLLAAWLFLRHRGKTDPAWKSPIVFFAALLVFAIVPYSFLTYQDHLPSRHSYFPSVGLAGLIGIFFAAVYERLDSVPMKRAAMAFLFLLVIGNGAYVWLKKEPQYRERAAPTRELFQALHAPTLRNAGLPVYVCGFPLMEPWWFQYAVPMFSPLTREDVVLLNSCTPQNGANVVAWDSNSQGYTVRFNRDTPPPVAVDAAIEESR